MKNHSGRFGLPPHADEAALEAALAPPAAADGGTIEAAMTADEQERAEARAVLLDPERRLHYERVHLQYRAIAAAVDALDSPVAVDSHRWRERLVEFEPPSED